MKRIVRSVLAVVYLITAFFEPSILNIGDGKRASVWLAIVKAVLILLTVGILVWIAQKWYPASNS